ncbi:MAG: TolA-binding protein [Verrucomicrobiales bacterium]
MIVDYPEEFKKEFSFELPANSHIQISSDGKFAMASARIKTKEDESLSDALEREVAAEQEDQDQRKSIARPASQIKPGNPIYLRVIDHDRNRSDAQDEVLIKIRASSGDLVGASLNETGAHTGIFEGTVATGELPAGALASDSSIDHSPLMAIDRDPQTSWISEPDGAAPKSITVDMKNLYAVDTAVLHATEPVRTQLHGSHDGRFWYPLTTPPTEPLPAKFGAMTQSIYEAVPSELKSWKQVTDFVKSQKPKSGGVSPQSLSAEAQPADEGKPAPTHSVLWQGKFHQPRDGAVRFEINAAGGAIYIAGHATVGLSADAYLKAGLHDLALFATGSGSLSATRAIENPNNPNVTQVPFTAEDFKLEGEEIAPTAAEVSQQPGKLTFRLPPAELRYLRFTFDEYKGESIAVNHIEISGGGKTHIPTEADILALARNNILEIAAGDTVTGTYIDAVTAGGLQRNKALNQSLTATYYNGQVLPISYDFVRAGNGGVTEIRKELLRIDPGERITIEVADFDMDATGTADSVEVEVQVNNDGEIQALTATETGPTTGIFKTEIEALAASPGDTIYLRYRDQQNTFPGHAATREERVFVRTPTEGQIRIIETRSVPREEAAPTISYLPPRDVELKGVTFTAPLTIEVIDPDSAKDSRSQVIVELKTQQGDPIQVACQISSAHGEADPALADERNPALFQGRFVGQVIMRLGGPQSPKAIPQTVELPGNLIGRVLSADEEPDQSLVHVLNLTGKDVVTATYIEQARQEKPDDQARLIADGSIQITSDDYEEPAELLFLGERLFIRVEDPDLDVSSERDHAIVQISTGTGESESVELEETLTHSGVFTASFALPASPQPSKDNGIIEGFFGDILTVGYLDQNPASQDSQLVLKQEIPIAEGTDGIVAAFSKIFGDEDLAIQTQFHIAESYFELFKSHLALEREEEATADLNAGRKVLRELAEDYPDPKYAPRVAYLLGQFSQELKEWPDAIDAYKTIVRDYPEHTLATDAQYKLGQCHEQAGEFDAALDAYVALAATYPDSPLIASVMMRINEHFYVAENYEIAAKVAEKFVEKFPTHQHAAKMAFRVGQSYHKDEDYPTAGDRFDQFIKLFPDDDLSPQALFWAGESYRLAKNIPLAFRRYNRCRWDFPETEAAKFARGRLALPELLQQFEREANLEND